MDRTVGPHIGAMNHTRRRIHGPSLDALLTAALALSIAGCAVPLRYGEPTSPSPAQLEAGRLLEDVAATASASGRGLLGPEEAFAVHSRMLAAQRQAVLDSRNPLETGGEVPASLWSDCTEGSALTSWTYEVCDVPNGTINGRVDMRAGRVRYDLRLAGGPDAQNQLNRLGELDVGDGRIVGTLETRSQIRFASEEEIAGISTGNTLGDVNTVSVWDVRIDEAMGCITGGSVMIEVEAKGELRGSRFVFDGCGSPPLVENASPLAE